MGLTFLGPAFILEEFYQSFPDSLSEYSSLQGRIYQLSHAALPSPGEELPQCDSVRKLLYTCRKDRKMTLQREREEANEPHMALRNCFVNVENRV